MTAVRSSGAVPGRARAAAPGPVASPGSIVLDRSLPATVLFAVTALLLAAGALPVADGELVLAGLTAAFVASLVSPARPAAAALTGDVAVVVPLAQLARRRAAVGRHGLPRRARPAPGAGDRARRAAPAGAASSLAALGTVAVLLLPELLGSGAPPPRRVPCALRAPRRRPRRARGQRDRPAGGPQAADRAARERARLLLAQVQSRADELDLATRMLAARAQTMTSVIDAVTEQSIIGTDIDGIIRVWNPGAEKMLGLPRADVVRKRSIVEFHLPEELEAAASAPAGLAALVHAAQEQGSDVRDWTYVAADGEPAHRLGRDHAAHRRPGRARRLELRRHRHDRGPRHRAHEGPVREPDQPRTAHPADARSSATWNSSWTTRTSRSPTSSART